MPGLYSRFRLWRARRAAIRSTDSGNEDALPAFLAQYPAELPRIISMTSGRIRSSSPWSGLVLCLGLMQVGAAEAIGLLRLLQLQNRDAHHWKIFRYKVKRETAHAFVMFMWKHGEAHELGAAYRLLGPEQITVHLERLAEKLDTAKPDDLLELLRPALDGSSGLHSWEEIEGKTAQKLIPFIYQHGQSADIEALLGHLGPAQGLRAIRLVAHQPRAACLPVLKKLWWSHEEDVQIDFDGVDNKEKDPHLVAFVDALAVAFGACAAADESYRNFDADEQHEENLREIYERHSGDIEEHNRLVEEYKSMGLSGHSPLDSPEQEEIAEFIKELREVIRLSEISIHKQEKKHHLDMSPGFILRRVLLNAQRYPIAVRQGAVYGLYKLLTQGHLDRETREEIFDLISRVVSDKNSEDFGERRVQLPPDADLSDLTQAIADGLQWTVDVMEGIHGEWQTEWKAYMAAKRAAEESGLPAEEDAENEGTTAERLELFEEISASRIRDVPARYTRLTEIVTLLCDMMPQALRFLQRYPLRLMRLDHHARLFGQYSKVGCHVQLWTRYTPPKEVGPVHRRFLELNDRSRPNSMGIYYELFRHPVLALPVIYHEYLHYGGTSGEPAAGIENETEVLIREILFARHLIARLAPADDREIPVFERQIAREIRNVHLESLMAQLLCDLNDDTVREQFNETILSTYGGQKSPQEAASLADSEVKTTNIGIHLENAIQTWQPDVPWPLVGDPGTETLSRNYRRILRQRFMMDHSIDRRRRDEILAEPVSRSLQQAWADYRRRSGALQPLTAARDTSILMALDLPSLIHLMVHRFAKPDRRARAMQGLSSR